VILIPLKFLFQITFSLPFDRVESYSCKMTAADKKLYSRFLNGEGGEQSHVPGSSVHGSELSALSRPQTFVGSPVSGSPIFGPQSLPTVFVRTISGSSHHSVDSGPQLCDTISQKTLFYLVSTLNSSFSPDYDFSDAKSEEFSKEPTMKWVRDSVRDCLSPVLGEEYPFFDVNLWSAIDEEIKLRECKIYSYNPDLNSDPYGEEGTLWSFNYFFYNKKMKRILFLTCRAMSNSVVYEDFNDGDIGDSMELDDPQPSTDTSTYPSQQMGSFLPPGVSLIF
jgi:hypothetical protein